MNSRRFIDLSCRGSHPSTLLSEISPSHHSKNRPSMSETGQQRPKFRCLRRVRFPQLRTLANGYRLGASIHTFRTAPYAAAFALTVKTRPSGRMPRLLLPKPNHGCQGDGVTRANFLRACHRPTLYEHELENGTAGVRPASARRVHSNRVARVKRFTLSEGPSKSARPRDRFGTQDAH